MAPQADLNVANQSGSAFRADLNNQLLALGTLMSGASEPSTTYAYMLWADTTAGVLKQRSAANNSWVTLGTLGSTNLGLLPSGGTLTAALGSAATPGVTFTGDTDTGLYSPGTNQVALGTNGQQRLAIDGSGRVLVGPGSAREVGGAVIPTLAVETLGQAAAFVRNSNDTSGGIIALGKSRGTAAGAVTAVQNGDILGELRFCGANGTDLTSIGAHIRAIVDGEVGTAGDTTDMPTSLAFSTTPDGAATATQRMVVTSAGLLGLGTSSPQSNLDVRGTDAAPSLTVNNGFQVASGSRNYGVVEIGSYNGGLYGWIQGKRPENNTASPLVINSLGGNVGIGLTSPGAALNVNGDFWIDAAGSTRLKVTHTGGGDMRIDNPTSTLAFATGGTEGFRLDGSRRLLIGTSSQGGSQLLQIQGDTSNSQNGGNILLRCGLAAGTVAAGTGLGGIAFGDSSGNRYALIEGYGDGTSGSSDYPGRIVLSTTADGASSPTERMRISNNGNILFAQTSLGVANGGAYFYNQDGITDFHLGIGNTRTDGSGSTLYLNRQGSDGTLIEFRQANTTEGSISVSGTTVTYGGGHIARWSQLPNDGDPSTLLKGTVMSNLDEMCEWGEEDNEQLNKTKVSDVEGDPNVAGVFVSTSFSDDGPLDFWLAMTGDMIIRIAEGVTVQRGDLLMSAGDGTAKPQDDDIVRSKTVAKVTSTHVTCTYDDGSYCVPCVLMAC